CGTPPSMYPEATRTCSAVRLALESLISRIQPTLYWPPCSISTAMALLIHPISAIWLPAPRVSGSTASIAHVYLLSRTEVTCCCDGLRVPPTSCSKPRAPCPPAYGRLYL